MTEPARVANVVRILEEMREKKACFLFRNDKQKSSHPKDEKWLALGIHPLAISPNLWYNTSNMAIKVTRKDQGEANENIIRRFNRKVLQSGMMPLKKSQMRFSKPISKRERRLKAIIREARKAEKTERIKLGLK